jgi:hypothetical protein
MTLSKNSNHYFSIIYIIFYLISKIYPCSHLYLFDIQYVSISGLSVYKKLADTIRPLLVRIRSVYTPSQMTLLN